MIDPEALHFPRYQRQERFAGVGRDGQRVLLTAKVLIVGLGGLGSWLSELLVRAGVSKLRLVDHDTVDWTNIARQGMYDELDAAEHSPKVLSAADCLGRINHDVDVEPIQSKLTRENIASLAEGVDLILDGCDDWATRFLINDYAVKRNVPWIFTGVVRAEGQVMCILPGRTACLQCVFESPPPAEQENRMKAAEVGVLGSAVATLAAWEATEAIKILAGRLEAVNPYLTKIDLWTNRVQFLAPPQPQGDCACCGRRTFAYLEHITE